MHNANPLVAFRDPLYITSYLDGRGTLVEERHELIKDIFQPGETRTISSAIYALLQTPLGDSATLRLCGISIILSFLALVLSEVLIRAGQRRLAR